MRRGLRASLALKIFLSFWLIHAVLFVILTLIHASGGGPAPGRGRAGAPPPRPPYTFLALSIVVSGAICLVLAQNLTAPLRKMGRATRRLQGGDLSARAGTGLEKRSDEIGEVVRDFDAMAERIESLLKAQQQLMSDISHELRSPLARLNVALELARRSCGGAAETHLARIEGEAERMNELVGRLLALARAESLGPLAHAEDFDLEDVVRQVVNDAQYEAARSNKHVACSVDGRASVRGDPVLVASAVENVVRNGIKYAPTDSTVEVAVLADARQARVVVRDYGGGVPPSELERVFLPFHRVDESRDRQSGGTGLGLSIAQRAIASQGGTVAAENAEGGGLRVTITLPVAKP